MLTCAAYPLLGCRKHELWVIGHRDISKLQETQEQAATAKSLQQQLQDSIDQAQQDAQVLKSQADRIAVLEQEGEAAVATSNQQSYDLREASERMSLLEIDIEKSKEELSAREASIASLQGELDRRQASLVAALDKAQQLGVELVYSQNEAKSSQADIQTREIRETDLFRQHELQSQQLLKVTEENMTLKSAQQSLMEQNTSILQGLKQINVEHSALKSQNVDLSDHILALQQANAVERADFGSERDTWHHNEQIASDKLSALETQKQSVTAQLCEMREQLEYAESKVTDLQERASNLEGKVQLAKNEAVSQIANAEAEWDRKEKTLRAELESKQVHASTLESDKQDLAKQMEIRLQALEQVLMSDIALTVFMCLAHLASIAPETSFSHDNKRRILVLIFKSCTIILWHECLS